MEPFEITSLKALQERTAEGGVITVTRGTFGDAVAHTVGCSALRQIRIPSRQGRYWWTQDMSTAVVILGARKCERCGRPRKYRHPSRPGL